MGDENSLFGFEEDLPEAFKGWVGLDPAESVKSRRKNILELMSIAPMQAGLRATESAR